MYKRWNSVGGKEMTLREKAQTQSLNSLRKEILNEYPFIYRPTDKGYDPFSLFGFEIGNGWNNLILDIFDKIKELDYPISLHILQIKEKFGELRFYYAVQDSTDKQFEDIQKIINEAEEKSTTTCEICGKEGYIDYDVYWLSCWCDECRKEQVRKQNDNKPSFKNGTTFF